MAIFSREALLALAAGTCATFLSQLIGLLLWDKRQAQIPHERLRRLWTECAASCLIQVVLNMPARRAVVVHLINVVMLGALILVGEEVGFAPTFLITFVYLMLGTQFNAAIRKLKPNDVLNLAWPARFWIKIFHAWTWPISLVVTLVGLWRLWR
jgi:hypothetical protein